MKIPVVFSFLLLISNLSAQKPSLDSLELKSATGHPMQYFISLPAQWTKEKEWPMVVIIESADKEYRENALRFVRARGEMPFILIAPFNVNNSRQGRRDPKIFPYHMETWDLIDRTGDCTFNMEGISKIVADVQQQYHGGQKFFITGFEAGAHTVWQFVFQRPEKLKGAAPVAGNYNQNSCMTDALFSRDSALIHLPVRGFAGALDPGFGPNGIVHYQWENASQAAAAHGFKNISETIIPDKAHVPLPGEVLNWFFDIWNDRD